MDKSYGNFNDRLQMTPEDSPHKKLQPKLCQKEYVDDNVPFEIAKEVSPDQRPIPKLVRQEDFQMSTPEGAKISNKTNICK